MFDFADESRRFSQFIKLVFARLGDMQHLPSSSEVNSWYWLFKRQADYRQRDVPEELLPPNRKVAETLQAVTKTARSDEERLEQQIQILQRCSTVEGEITVSKVRQVAAALDIKPESAPEAPAFIARPLSDLTGSEWHRVCTIGNDLHSVLHGSDGAEQRKKLLRMAASLQDICRHQTAWVFAAFKADRFVGCVMRAMVTKKIPFIGRDGKQRFRRIYAEHDLRVVGGEELLKAELPFTDDPEDGESFLRFAGCRGDRKVRQLVGHITPRIDSGLVIEKLDLETLQNWLARGGIPDGTFTDEVLEPTDDTAE